MQRKYLEWILERLQGVLYRGNELVPLEELTCEMKVVLRKQLSKLEARKSKKEIAWRDWRD